MNEKELRDERTRLVLEKEQLEKKIDLVDTELERIKVFRMYGLKDGDIIKHKGRIGRVSIDKTNLRIQYQRKDGTFSKRKEYLFFGPCHL